MKIAILGNGPMALEAYLVLTDLEAAVTVFSSKGWDQSLRPWLELEKKCIDLSLPLVTFKGQKFKTMSEYAENYFFPKSQEIEIVLAPVERVHKCFLGTWEKPAQSSRLDDLFRVVYSKSGLPEDLTEIDKWDPAILDSLKLPVEHYADFDLVVDARDPWESPLPLGTHGSFALNEKQGVDGKLFYGMDILDSMDKEGEKRVVLVGQGLLGFMLHHYLLKVKKDWKVSLLCKEKKAFETLGKSDPHIARLSEMATAEYKALKAEYYQEFKMKTQEWLELEDYVQAKVKRPVLKSGNLDIFEGVSVMALDKLTDRDGVYVTLESNPYAAPETEFMIKSLEADLVWVANGFQKQADLFSSLAIDKQLLESGNPCVGEIGFYALNFGQGEWDGLNWERELQKIHLIIEDIKKYFKRRG